MSVPCSFCTKTFLSLRILHRHVKKMHINTPKDVLKAVKSQDKHMCKMCNKTFLTSGNLGRHTYHSHIKKRLNSVSPNDKSKNPVNANRNTYQTNNDRHNQFMMPIYGCSLCTFTGKQQRDVKIHQSHKHRSELKGDGCFVTNNDVNASETKLVSRIKLEDKKRKKKRNKFTKLKSNCARVKAIKAAAKGSKRVLGSKKKVHFSALKTKARKSKVSVSIDTADKTCISSAGSSASLDDSSCTNEATSSVMSEFESFDGRTTTIASSQNMPYPVMLFDGQGGVSLASADHLPRLQQFLPTEIQYDSSPFTYNDIAESNIEITQQPLPGSLPAFSTAAIQNVHIKSEPDPNSLEYGQVMMSSNPAETILHSDSNQQILESTHLINQIQTGSPTIMGNLAKRRQISLSPRYKDENDFFQGSHVDYSELSPRSHVIYLREPLSDQLLSNGRESFILRPTENVHNGGREHGMMDYVTRSEECESIFKKCYTNIGHGNRLLKGLIRFWKEERLCDAQLTSGNTVIKMHKLVLTSSSPTCLRIAENSSMAKTLDIHLPADLSLAALKAVVVFMYEGVLSLTKNTVNHVHRIAKILKLDSVISHCSEFHNEYEEEEKRRAGFSGIAVCDMNGDSHKLMISSTNEISELIDDRVSDKSNVIMDGDASDNGADRYVDVVDLSDREAPSGPPIGRLKDQSVADNGQTEEPVTIDTGQSADTGNPGDNDDVNEHLPNTQESDIDVNDGSVRLSKAYTTADHSTLLTDHIAAMWREESLCDAQIRLGSHTVKTHKLVLACASPMLDTLMEKLPIHLSLELRLPADLPLDAVQTFLQCLYEGHLKLTEQNHDHICKIATILKINYIIDFCSDFKQFLLDSSATNNNEKLDVVLGVEDAALSDVCVK